MLRRRPLRLETLETRFALATAIVNMLGNAGDADPLDGICDVDLLTPGAQCTLTAAAQHLNANNGGTLSFEIGGSFDPVEFTTTVAIDGLGKSISLTTAQPLKLLAGGSVQNLNLAGELHFQGSDGLIKNNTIGFGRGLLVVGDRNLIQQNSLIGGTSDQVDPRGAVTVRGSSNRIEANEIGVSGNLAVPNAGAGVFIDGNFVSASNVVVGNTIGASARGVEIRGPLATFNRVEGNRIGTDATGAIDLGNMVGVEITAATDTIVGGSSSDKSNLISANVVGVIIIGPAPRNVVEGNVIGLSATGAALGNDQEGVYIFSPGGTTEDVTLRGNIISANGRHGVWIEASGVKMFSNRIGTDATGLLDRGNGGDGIRIEANPLNPANGDNGSFNVIGAVGQANLISGNAGEGIGVLQGRSNVIQSNLIGVAANGNEPLANGGFGVAVVGGQLNMVGGISNGNLISGNGLSGVLLSGTSQSSVLGNTIGLSGNGTAKIPNELSGVEINGGNGNKIGDTTNGSGNFIAGNASHGISVGFQATQTTILRNTIGTNAQNVFGLGNGGAGIQAYEAPQTIIGQSNAGNVISGNSGAGIAIVVSDQAQIRGNLIGMAANSAPLRNQQGGIEVSNSAQTIIGGPTAGDRNYISANSLFGIALTNGAHHSQVSNNYIGSDLTGTAIPSNAQQPVGVLIASGAHDNLIGGTGASGSGNLISGNAGPGVRIENAGSSNNQVGSNVIGLNATQQSLLPNQTDGIVITGGASANIIGGSLNGASNVIAGNLGNGILLDGGATLNTVQRNAIGFNPSSNQLFGNGAHGVRLNTATNNLIGDPTAQHGNAFRGHNQQSAVRVNAGAVGNRILGNSMVLNAAGGITLSGPLANLLRQPIINKVTPNGSNYNVTGQVAGAVGSSVRVDFYLSQQAPATGFGEGQIAVGSTNVTIPAGGIATFNVAVPNPNGYPLVTATATDNTNTTYDFSRATSPNHAPVTVASLVTTGPTNDFQPVQFTATLQSTAGAPNGTVEFYDGSQLLGSATLNAQRQAVFAVQLPQQGIHNIYAVYKGTAIFAGVISSALAVNIVAAPPNQVPVANTDSAVASEDGTVTINVLANDSDPDGGTILATSVVITQQPQHGTVSVNATTGVVTYAPHTNYDGADQFRYTVTDNRGGVSNVGVVNITVTDTPEPFYNRARPVDVDNDNHITPNDILLIINLLNSQGAGFFPAPSGQVTVFSDVDGDNALSPSDALIVINYLNTFGASEGELTNDANAAFDAGASVLQDAALEAWLLFDEAETSQRKVTRTR